MAMKWREIDDLEKRSGMLDRSKRFLVYAKRWERHTDEFFHECFVCRIAWCVDITGGDWRVNPQNYVGLPEEYYPVLWANFDWPEDA